MIQEGNYEEAMHKYTLALEHVNFELNFRPKISNQFTLIEL